MAHWHDHSVHVCLTTGKDLWNSSSWRWNLPQRGSLGSKKKKLFSPCLYLFIFLPRILSMDTETITLFSLTSKNITVNNVFLLVANHYCLHSCYFCLSELHELAALAVAEVLDNMYSAAYSIMKHSIVEKTDNNDSWSNNTKVFFKKFVGLCLKIQTTTTQ